MFSRSRAGAAATLRPAARPFLLFKEGAAAAEETGGTAGAGATSNSTSSTTSTSSSDSPKTDGVAAAAAAVRSLAPGATLGSVSDAAAATSALWPDRRTERGGEKHETEGENDGDDEEEENAAADELSEWLARHTVAFLDAAALLQGALSHQYCTPETCPAMTAGPRHEYLWAEPEIPGGGGGAGREGGEKREDATFSASTSSTPSEAAPPRTKKKHQQAKKPSRLPARDYAAALFSWADALLASPQAFPQAKGEPFPSGFKAKALQPLYRRLCRVFAHFYFAHWREVSDPRGLNASAHLATVFKHYVAFGREHGLLPEGELDPVRPLVEALLPCSLNSPKEEQAPLPLPLLPPPSKAAAVARVEVSASSAAIG